MALAINDVLDRLRQAQAEYEAALATEDPMERHTALRLAYGGLSQAASDAYMIYSSKPKNNAFKEGGLSTWARAELEAMTNTMGAQYFRQGLTPTSRMEGEFGRWLERVRTFVDRLNADFQLDVGQAAAKDWKEDEIKRKQRQIEDFNKNMMGTDGVVGW
ncbi:hypothetical protein [Adlercreutzia sp. ZJ242]|uniref:hypothetical protein n=1 Tax=Adlercreutzia sp. ZJ242 TaxID=2709409 RepID=UPI0013EAEBAC|nr:hypothetical protein [Adlercreutzia sp. ZJ242]